MWMNYIYFCLILCIYIYADASPKRRSSHKNAIYRRKNERRKENEKRNCWMTLNANEHFATMEVLEAKYAKARKEFDEQQLLDSFDEEMLGNLLENQGAGNREAQKAGNQKSLIPSGINLGGHSMMRTPDSIMFFHRMKLRNDTRFRVKYLSSNFSTMTMKTELALNDLHLVGNYERVLTEEDPSLLQYIPSYGEIEVLLRDVYYKMDGRYRMQKDRMYLETVLSELYVPYDGILMLYTNSSDKEQQTLQTKNIADFLDRLKTDLDLWMKDFFNEFLLDMSPMKAEKTFMQYDKERITTLNRYVDRALMFLKNRLKALEADTVKLPSFMIYAFNGMVLKLNYGSLSGLDTMYRRSMATNSVEKDVRKVDALIAFSSLKARYSLEMQLTTGAPPLLGSLILSGDELSTIMSISMVKEPLFVDVNFDFIQQLKPESLIVEGSAGRMISTFKHVLELHIVAIMTNTMIDQVKQLSSLSKCIPTFVITNNNDEVQDGKYYKGIDMQESMERLKDRQKLNCALNNRECDPCRPGSPFYPCTWPTRNPDNTRRTTLVLTTSRTTTTMPTTRTTMPTITTTMPTTTTTTPTTTTTTPTTTTTTPTTTTTTPTTTTARTTTTEPSTTTPCYWPRNCCKCNRVHH